MARLHLPDALPAALDEILASLIEDRAVEQVIEAQTAGRELEEFFLCLGGMARQAMVIAGEETHLSLSVGAVLVEKGFGA